MMLVDKELYLSLEESVFNIVADRPDSSTRAVAHHRNRTVASTRVTSMVTASIGKAISEATVRQRLHMNGLYPRVPRVCVPLSVQPRGARSKWCMEHGNGTLSH
ncbi:transposable element Tc1 transposase [Trichonephila clavipes]|nr:transposable element Tc1 transposase [Trichonephila clavipes]